VWKPHGQARGILPFGLIKLILIGYLKNKYLTDGVNTMEIVYNKPVKKAGEILKVPRCYPLISFYHQGGKI